MRKCVCRVKIEKGDKPLDVFKMCSFYCSKGCAYCAKNNLNRYDFNFKKKKFYYECADCGYSTEHKGKTDHNCEV